MTNESEIVPGKATPTAEPNQLVQEAGRAIRRRNAVRHGLTANPAVLPVEDARGYHTMLEDLTAAIQPCGPVEELLVGRIATSLFRLNRVVEVEQAVAARQVATIPASPTEIASLIERFYQCWRWRDEPEHDKEKTRKARKAKLAREGRPWMRVRRSGLDRLPSLLQEMKRTSDGNRALLEILRELERECQRDPQGVSDESLEQLAAVLGDPASSFPHCYEEASTGNALRAVGEVPARRGTRWELLQGLRTWEGSTPLPPQIESALRACEKSLRTEIHALFDDFQQSWRAGMAKAALVPEEKELAKLTRYETQAERTLFRSLHVLAQLRGESTAELGAAIRNAALPT